MLRQGCSIDALPDGLLLCLSQIKMLKKFLKKHMIVFVELVNLVLNLATEFTGWDITGLECSTMQLIMPNDAMPIRFMDTLCNMRWDMYMQLKHHGHFKYGAWTLLVSSARRHLKDNNLSLE